MKCSHGISDFLEEMCSLFPFCSFPVSLHWLLRKAFLLFSGTLPSEAYIFPCLLCILLLFFKIPLRSWITFPQALDHIYELSLALGISSISWVFVRSCWFYTAQIPWRGLNCVLCPWYLECPSPANPNIHCSLIPACASSSPAFLMMYSAGWQYTALTYSFSYLEPVCCSMSSSNCCFLTCIQVSQEAGQVIWYAPLFQNCPQFIVIPQSRLWHSQ